VSTPDTEASAAKARSRDEARARRRSGAAPDATALAESALAWLESQPGPRRVTCYASYGTEPATGILRERLIAAGFEVLLPRVSGDSLDWVLDGGPTTTSPMGMDEPMGPAVDLLPLRAMLIPALAVTLAGDRLGKGRGYYDRVLSALGDPPAPIAALVGDDDIVTSLPTQSHDRRVDVIVTPTRLVHCAQD
jgi:5-formyltetrahydrofolate cyclo-ligase